jgi:hypothetical protein
MSAALDMLAVIGAPVFWTAVWLICRPVRERGWVG